MARGSKVKRTVCQLALIPLLLSATGAIGASNPQTNSSARLILEVINRHFTVGRKIPSVYLRVYSDGTAECHTERYWDESDMVKRKTLSPPELQQLRAVLDNPELLHVQKKYGLMYGVIDSWMQWDIRVPHRWHAESIEVLNVSPPSARKRNQDYPPAVLKLGCSIWKLRYEVYGDAQGGGQPFYHIDDCEAALGIQ